MHRLLQRPLLRAPRILHARQLMPAFRLGQPFSPGGRIALGPLQAPQFHNVAIIVAHGRPPDLRPYCVSLRQSHYRYAAELFFWILAGADPCNEFPKRWKSAREGSTAPPCGSWGAWKSKGRASHTVLVARQTNPDFSARFRTLRNFRFASRVADKLRGAESLFCRCAAPPSAPPGEAPSKPRTGFSFSASSISPSFCFAFSRSDARAPQR